MAANLNETAAAFKKLHEPRSPIILANIWDPPSLHSLLTLNTSQSQPVKAVATASWAIAESLGLRDEDLTAEQNLAAVSRIAPHARAAGLPLTVDLQDGYGYGDAIASVVARAVRLGAAGANIEDSIPSRGFSRGIAGSLYGVEEQVERLRTALRAAGEAGCAEFVVNARCDVFRLEAPVPGPDDETTLREAVRRGKAYLEAGATTVFFWGGAGRGLRTSEVERLVRELDGRVAVKLGGGSGALTTEELGELGVARISVGPSLFLVAMKAVRDAAGAILTGGGLP
ncbi:Phosphoenolpyruvate/pyruvate domain-containing protein [Sodiomyces alkalinus F11]|uniref:Phosphoenolpyruvate/pyruvate domain-containing protein n=1 Tax=Sodiomyces alkalinus (strain CBS 110278 / VKM F-3762 / F11) TaxID=1314773 RepID=A0A3N2PWX8_SODAK|nr:Phosphoenolpyruvate/pyruvate domain-containing protein [Sodiomyces alkalinus F11]ROT39029.1 Phosphoenolpyruvate/pyruvate domain-containing protein [Sodiomyces alkalinus F11]